MEQIHGGNIYGKSHIALDFSVNGNPFGIPSAVKEAICKSIDQMECYPDLHQIALKQEIACWENQYLNCKIAEQHIVCGNGASELIHAIVQCLLPKKALIPAPAFSGYERACLANRCDIAYAICHRDQDYRIDSSFLEQLTKEIDICFLCHPSNPVGVSVEKSLLLQIIEKCEALGIYLIIDECFLPFLVDWTSKSTLPFYQKYQKLIILRAFTKVFACPGLRLGYCINSDFTLLERLQMCLPEWNVSGIAQIAGIAALQETQYLHDTVVYLQRERTWLVQELEKLGCHVYPGEADFLLFEGPKGLYERLLAEGILIRDCQNYKGLDTDFSYYRIAIRKHKDNQFLIHALQRILASKIN